MFNGVGRWKLFWSHESPKNFNIDWPLKTYWLILFFKAGDIVWVIHLLSH